MEHPSDLPSWISDSHRSDMLDWVEFNENAPVVRIPPVSIIWYRGMPPFLDVLSLPLELWVWIYVFFISLCLFMLPCVSGFRFNPCRKIKLIC